LDQILDAFGGIGGNTLSFAEFAHNVLVFEIDRIKANIIKQKAITEGFSEKIDVLFENFFMCRNL